MAAGRLASIERQPPRIKVVYEVAGRRNSGWEEVRASTAERMEDPFDELSAPHHVVYYRIDEPQVFATEYGLAGAEVKRSHADGWGWTFGTLEQVNRSHLTARVEFAADGAQHECEAWAGATLRPRTGRRLAHLWRCCTCRQTRATTRCAP